MTVEEITALADCLGWDIQHIKKYRPERSHLIALIYHASLGKDVGQALDRLIRSTPTILDAVDEFVANEAAMPESKPGAEDSTENRRRSAAVGIRIAKDKYGDKYRQIPWPEGADLDGKLDAHLIVLSLIVHKLSMANELEHFRQEVERTGVFRDKVERTVVDTLQGIARLIPKED